MSSINFFTSHQLIPPFARALTINRTLLSFDAPQNFHTASSSPTDVDVIAQMLSVNSSLTSLRMTIERKTLEQQHKCLEESLMKNTSIIDLDLCASPYSPPEWSTCLLRNQVRSGFFV